MKLLSNYAVMLKDIIVIEKDPAIFDSIVYTNEASFKLCGHVKRHNCVYWYSKNKHLI